MEQLMNGPNRQKGMGLWGMLFVFGVIGFVALVTIKCTPIYLAHLEIQTAVNDVADDSSYANASPFEIRRALQRRFDVDDVTQLKTKDIKIQREDNTRVISYDYEVRVALFANLSLVIQFKDAVRVKTS
ncbi:MAG: DUF4845 domain-containing protein [Nevskiales bacterium]|uniref:DUF4845 domain-containing protein n=2 Tax=Abyssibacter profundi TaxID=2182787 RepID=A0A363UKB7_9GAMM|nr:DUF4845 domain-containing protein [Nevskiales bacterium]PWN55858.1 DUF4845 domain-containing protein [Abyssibacter profundi]